MQSKGAIKLFAVLLVIAAIFQLSFSFVTRGVEKDAEEYAAKHNIPHIFTSLEEMAAKGIKIE